MFELDSRVTSEIAVWLDEAAEIPATAQAALLMRLAEVAPDWLEALAAAHLHSTKTRYIQGIGRPEVDPALGVIAIPLDSFAGAVEKGYDAFDMRSLLGGEESKVIRFRQKWAEADWGGAEGFGTPISAHEVSGLSTAEVARIGRQALQALRNAPMSGVSQRNRRISSATKGLTASRFGKPLPARLQGLRRERIRKDRRAPGAAEFEHAIYRTISENSDPQSWQHPGYKGAELFPKLVADMDKFATDVIKDLLP